MGGVGVAGLGLTFETSHLADQKCGLKFGEPVVGAATGTRAGTPATWSVIVVTQIGEGVVVGEDRAAFAGGEVFAGLKTKAAAEALRADGLSTPLGEWRLTRVFDEW